jgi:hypothetical protein
MTELVNDGRASPELGFHGRQDSLVPEDAGLCPQPPRKGVRDV